MRDYSTLGVARLTNQFQDSPKLKALVAGILSGFTRIENTLDQLKTERWIETAVGAQLDGVGYIVGEPRQGRNDDDYRLAIRFRVFINVSKGTPPDMIYGLRYITQADSIQYQETYPATVLMWTDGYSATSDIGTVMQDLAPAAIADTDIAVSFGENPFRVSNENETPDEQSELAGFVASVWHCLDGRTLKTISGKRIRLRYNYEVFNTPMRLTGIFEPRA